MKDEQKTLFVGNLSFNVTIEQLEEIFGQVEGVKVEKVKIPLDRETERPRGFGFVELASADMVDKAIEAMNNKEVDGRMISVKVAMPPRTDNGGGSRGGYQQNNNFRSGGRRF